MERSFDEFGYEVSAVAHENKLSIEFSVHPSSIHQNPIFKGYIKWDGCSNWHLYGDNYQLYFCSKNESLNFGVLLSKLYDWAAELLPQYKDDIGNKK